MVETFWSLDGHLVDDDGVLAGADLTMLAAVRRTVATVDVSLPTALAMASEHPASFLRLGDQLGRIAPGHRASMIAIRPDRVSACWIDGHLQTP